MLENNSLFILQKYDLADLFAIYNFVNLKQNLALKTNTNHSSKLHLIPIHGIIMCFDT